jgi:hypothetical protein
MGRYLDGVQNTDACGGGVLEFTPGPSAPSTGLYYQCVSHFYMGWKIIITEPEIPTTGKKKKLIQFLEYLTINFNRFHWNNCNNCYNGNHCHHWIYWNDWFIYWNNWKHRNYWKYRNYWKHRNHR